MSRGEGEHTKRMASALSWGQRRQWWSGERHSFPLFVAGNRKTSRGEDVDQGKLKRANMNISRGDIDQGKLQLPFGAGNWKMSILISESFNFPLMRRIRRSVEEKVNTLIKKSSNFPFMRGIGRLVRKL